MLHGASELGDVAEKQATPTMKVLNKDDRTLPGLSTKVYLPEVRVD